MKQATVIAVIGLLCLGSSCVWAESQNPFGFETNTHPLEYEYCKKYSEVSEFFDSHFEYQCGSAPRMHPDIETFYLEFVEDVGLCSIKARSFDFVGDLDFTGDSRRDRVDSFKDQVAQKYGPPTNKTEEGDLNDHFPLKGNGIKYRYDWDQRAGFSGLGNVSNIHVILFASYPDTVLVNFELNTREACDKKVDEMRTTAF